MSTWESVIAKATALSLTSTDEQKKLMHRLGVELLAVIPTLEGKAMQCKLKPDPKQYKKVTAYLALLRGIPMADAVTCLIQQEKAVMTDSLYCIIRNMLNNEPSLQHWLQLFDTAY